MLAARHNDDDEDIYVYICIYIYIIDIQSASEDNGFGLLWYRIYEVFHINLCECSMHGYFYIFLFRFIKLTYRTYTV